MIQKSLLAAFIIYTKDVMSVH